MLSLILSLMIYIMTKNNIDLPKGNWQQLPITHFKQATDGEAVAEQTKVWLKYDVDYLHVKFECLNDEFVHTNGYIEHNTPMYNQEVFELFITDESGTAKNYLEFEINPNNATWIGKINNPTGKAPAKADMIDHKAALEMGLKHHVKMAKDSWSGEFSIPFKMIGKVQNNYQLNFYRIITTEPHADKKWKGNLENCLFVCWNPTMSGKIPAFHVPASFGKLTLK